VEVDEDTSPEVGDDAATRTEASSAVKPRRKTRVAAVKQSVSAAAEKVEAAKTAKLEAKKKKKKRKRKRSPPSTVETPVIPTPPSREVVSDEEEDEVNDDPSVIEDRTMRRSLSLAAKRQRELGRKRRRMTSVKSWKRSGLLLVHMKGCLC
jgi:hypothetical protein